MRQEKILERRRWIAKPTISYSVMFIRGRTVDAVVQLAPELEESAAIPKTMYPFCILFVVIFNVRTWSMKYIVGLYRVVACGYYLLFHFVHSKNGVFPKKRIRFDSYWYFRYVGNTKLFLIIQSLADFRHNRVMLDRLMYNLTKEQDSSLTEGHQE